MTTPSPRRPGRLALAVAVLVPTLLALLVFQVTTARVATAGDEPHYLVMADSLVTDGSLDLRHAYAREEKAVAFIGPVAPHVIRLDERWLPYHALGLPVLVAPAFRFGGQAAVRVFLCLALAVLPWAIFSFARRQLAPREAAWLAVGIVACSPACFGASQIYPDLPAGAFATALAVWFLHRDEEDAHPVDWGAAGLAMGLLAWLNVKFAVTSGVFFVGLVGFAWRAWRRGRLSGAVLAIVAAGFCAVGTATLVGFNLWAYGHAAGGRPLNEVGSPLARAAEIFLGLHLDQGQGMFLRNPLLLVGVVSLPVFFRRRPAQATFWVLLYLSLIVPNAFELSRYGGGAPTSRFAWPAMWLWAVPTVAGLAAWPRLRRWLPRLTILALVYQLALAIRWIANPDVLFPVLGETIADRDHFFPLALGRILPSYYFWDFSGYWTYLPNLVAMVTVIGLFALGIAMARVPSSGVLEVRDTTGRA